MRPGAAGLRRARGLLEPCDSGRPCRAVGGVQKGNRRAAPFGFPRWALSSARNRISGRHPKGRDAKGGSGSEASSTRRPRTREGDAQKTERNRQAMEGIYRTAIQADAVTPTW